MSVWTTAGVIADATFDDPANARVIYLAVAGLVLLAVLLGVGTWLWWRSSKVENPVLAPLEVMGTRRWWKSDFNERQRRLEAVRPDIDDPDADSDVVDGDAAAPAEPVDLDHVLVRDDPHTFDDLVDPGAAVAPEASGDAAAESESLPAEPVPGEPLSAEPAPAVDDTMAPVEPDVAESAVAEPVPEAEPVPDEPIVVSQPVPRSIVIDTAPKPRDTPPDLGPEAAESDPTPAPIDPLLRLQSE